MRQQRLQRVLKLQVRRQRAAGGIKPAQLSGQQCGGIQHAHATVGFQLHAGNQLAPQLQLSGIAGYGSW